METIPSFSPLAARLSILVDEILPGDGAEDTLGKVVALVFCALLQMLIRVCVALDARAAAGVVPVMDGAAVVARRVLPRPSVRGSRADCWERRRPDTLSVKRNEMVAATAGFTSESDGSGEGLPWFDARRRPRRIAVPARNQAHQTPFKHVYSVTLS